MAVPRMSAPLIGVIVLWLAVPLAAQTAAREEMTAITGDVTAIEAVRDTFQKQAEAKRDTAVKPIVVSLVFPSLISYPARFGHLGKADLEVTIRRNGDRWLAGTAVTPKWHPAPSFADGSGLTISETQLKGNLRVKLNFARGTWHHHCVGSDLDIAIDAKITAAGVQGTYSTSGIAPLPETPWLDHSSDGVPARLDSSPVPARAGTFTGTIRLATFVATPMTAPQMEMEDEWTVTIGRKACWLEAKASVLYRQIYAYALATQHGLAIEHAWELAPGCIPNRPEAKPAARQAPKPDKPTPKRPGGKAPPAKGGAKAPVADPDLPGLDLPRDPLDAKEPAKAPDGQQEKKVLALLSAVRAHVSVMRQTAESYRPHTATGASGCGDATFGPWFGEEPLPCEKDRPNVLPSAAPVGPEEWKKVSGWRIVGPFPTLYREADLHALPEVVPAWDLGHAPAPAVLPAATQSADKESKDAAKKDDEDTTVVPPPEASSSAYSGLGHTRPPAYGEPDKHGRTSDAAGSSYYASAEINAPADQDVFLAVVVNDAGALWINDRLVWRSPIAKDPRSEEQTGVFLAHLVKGVNRLMFRGDNYVDDTYFSVYVCTQGSPLPADGAKARQQQRADAYAKLPPQTQAIRGWRGDWTGKFAGTSPPVAWDIEKGINVLWRKPMEPCHATPVIVGDKLFTSVEPHTLVCVNKNTGDILWQRDADIIEFRDAALQQEAMTVRAQAAKAEAELAALGATKEERLKALAAKGLSDAQADERLKELSRATNTRDLMRKAGALGPSWGHLTGHTISTPVTDGRHIFVKYNTRALACFDLDGNRKWMIDHGGSTGTCSHVPSPVLVGGKLIMMVPDPGFATPHAYMTVTSALKAYDAETGKLLWTARPAPATSGEVTGTPLPMRLTNGTDTIDVIVTANGSVVRADDGKILRMYLGTREKYGSPITDGRGVVYITGPGSKAAYELILQDRDHVGVRTLWHVYHPGVGYDSGNYPLLHEGLLYAFGWRLDVLDAASGNILAMRHEPLWIRPGRCYAPIAMAGGKLYFADFGNFFGQPMGRHHGSGMSVSETGRDGLILARNRIDLMTAGPCFDGDRIYLRCHRSFICVGYTGDAGKSHEAQAVAREVLSSLFPDRPTADPAIAVKPRGSEAGDVWRSAPPLWAKDIPEFWLLIDSVAENQAAPLRDELVKSDLSAASGSKDSYTIKLAGEERRCGVLHGYNAKNWKKDGRLVPAAAGAGKGVSFFFTVVRNDFRRLLRVELAGPPARLWIGGTEVRHNQLIDLPEGQFTMVMEVPLAEVAADALGIRLVFWPSRGAAEDLAEWKAGIARRRAYLESAIQLAPETETARKAKVSLDAAK